MANRNRLDLQISKTSALICAAVLLASITLAQTPNVPSTEGAAQANPAGGKQVETIVIFRHGEKPAAGLGQISPQGFNRAIGLIKVLPEKFGNPTALFAPDPREKVQDFGKLYNYVRPLATIEPLAISLGMPVQTPCGYRDVEELEDELCSPRYAQATIFVAWGTRLCPANRCRPGQAFRRRRARSAKLAGKRL